jgi:FkbM family methyltransferase
MNLRHRAKVFIESMTGIRLFQSLPHGIDPCYDLARRGIDLRTILDVGANVGQSALTMLETFPKAEIHCFEPVSSTFATMQRNLSGTRCRCIHSAVGNEVGEARISVGGTSLTNSLVNSRDGDTFETVRVTTVDAYTEERSLPTVDLLKIDAEGYDLHVLEGASRSFAGGRVKFVAVEAGFCFEGTAHVAFQRLREHLENHGFSLFGLYHQTPSWSGDNSLLFADVLFAHASTNRR